MTFSPGIAADRKEQITQILGVHVVDSLDRYLGMPSVVGKSKQHIFSIIRERIWKRINGWGENTLSMPGREVLIKAVLQSIPTYIISCFLLPGHLIKSIEAAVRSFWWGSNGTKKLAWLSWSQLCRPKQSGGLGFRDLHTFNLALLARQGWRLITQPDSLVPRIFHARYYPNGTFMEAALGSRPSATWRGILKARPLIKQGLRIRVGNGYFTEIWDSPWIPDDGRFTLFTTRPPDCYFPWKVADLVDPESNAWNIKMTESTFWPIDRNRILSVPLGAITSDDRVVWHYTKDGKFLVKSAYQLLLAAKFSEGESRVGSSSGVPDVRWSELWGLNLLPKVRMFLWRATKNILPLGAELFRRHISENPLCGHCCNHLETISHVSMQCRGLGDIWSSHPFQVPQAEVHDLFGACIRG